MFCRIRNSIFAFWNEPFAAVAYLSSDATDPLQKTRLGGLGHTQACLSKRHKYATVYRGFNPTQSVLCLATATNLHVFVRLVLRCSAIGSSEELVTFDAMCDFRRERVVIPKGIVSFHSWLVGYANLSQWKERNVYRHPTVRKPFFPVDHSPCPPSQGKAGNQPRDISQSRKRSIPISVFTHTYLPVQGLTPPLLAHTDLFFLSFFFFSISAFNNLT